MYPVAPVNNTFILQFPFLLPVSIYSIICWDAEKRIEKAVEGESIGMKKARTWGPCDVQICVIMYEL